MRFCLILFSVLVMATGLTGPRTLAQEHRKMKKKALIVVTNHTALGTTGRTTGYYLPEVTHPYFALTEAGISVDFVSPIGGKAPMDEKSRDLSDSDNRRFLESADLMGRLDRTLRPGDVRAGDYSAIIFAGGHGTMWDFPANPSLARLGAAIYEAGGIVAAVCHGPAGLVDLTLSDGTYLVAGKTIATFTNEEEAAVGLTEVVPFLLESKLIERGAKVKKAGLWQANTVVDGRLVTGQNPASAKGVGQAVATLLGAASIK